MTIFRGTEIYLIVLSLVWKYYCQGFQVLSGSIIAKVVKFGLEVLLSRFSSLVWKFYFQGRQVWPGSFIVKVVKFGMEVCQGCKL